MLAGFWASNCRREGFAAERADLLNFIEKNNIKNLEGSPLDAKLLKGEYIAAHI
jgi:hypothetical protein